MSGADIVIGSMDTEMRVIAGSTLAGERLARRRPSVGDPLASDDLRQRASQDPRIESKAVSLDILDVEPEACRPIERVAPRYLRQTGDARPHLVAAPLLRRIARQVFDQQRTRTDERQLSAQHI